MKINLNQLDMDELHEFEEVVYEKRGRKNKVKKFKTDEMRVRGRKPKKFRDYNKTKSNKVLKSD